MLADPLDEGQVSLAQLAPQRGVAFGVGRVINDFAERVAGRDVGATIDPVTFMSSGQRGTSFTDAQRESGIRMHPEVRLQKGLDGIGIYD
jgi:hypothetical protein